MMTQTCSYTSTESGSCSKDAQVRGLCPAHYSKTRRDGLCEKSVSTEHFGILRCCKRRYHGSHCLPDVTGLEFNGWRILDRITTSGPYCGRRWQVIRIADGKQRAAHVHYILDRRLREKKVRPTKHQYLCECGVLVWSSAEGSHRRGVLHRRFQDVTAMLNVPCMTYEKVANTLGVSTQWVQQFATKKLGHRQEERTVLCQTGRFQAEHSQLVNELKTHGLSWRIDQKKHGVLFGSIFVNDRKSLIRRCQKTGRYYPLRGSSVPHDFLFIRINEGWLIFPKGQEPPLTGTYVKIGEKLRPGDPNNRSDYASYLNRWDLLTEART